MIRRLGYLLAGIAIAIFPFVTPNDYFLRLGQDIAIWAIAAIGLNLLLGYSGQLSLGQAGFYALGAYGSGIAATSFGWPLALSIPLGLLVAGVAGAVIGLVALRARTHYLAMVTLAFGFIVQIVAQRWVGLTGGSMGLIGVPQLNFGDFARGPIYFFWIAAFSYLLVQIAMDYVDRSHLGRNLQAIKASESFALTAGINARLWRAGVFVVSAILAGAAGILFAHQSGYVSSDAFDLERSINLLIAVVIGGLGRPYGAILGATVLILLNQLTAGLYNYATMILGAILLGVMLFFPGGAAGGIERLLRAFAPRRAEPAPQVDPQPAAFPVRSAPAGAIVLELLEVTKSYAGVRAVDRVSMAVQAGTIHALIGPNGAGKSTLINVVSGLYAPDSGRVRYLGRDVTEAPPNARAEAGIARTFQNLQLINTLTVIDNVMLGLPPRHGPLGGFLRFLVSDRERERTRGEAMRLLAFFRIERFADAYPGDLAYGHRKLCELARALAQAPTLMLLDEPIAGLNEQEVREVAATISSLKKLGVTILLVEHNMTFVMALSDTITVLDYGRKIAEGPPAAVQRDAAVRSAYLGQEAA